jgi:mono/diheme cytochrome c family protein
MRKRGRKATTAAVLLLTTACGCGASQTGTDSARLARGRIHYLATCSRCHQPDGSGYAQVFPNLAGNPIVRDKDPSAVIAIVLHGRRSMPSFGSQPPEELAEIISYIRHAWGNGASPVTPTQVR